ncbi:LysR family substrate-binding domain-containing protein [Mycobacterium sp. NPDC003323]
MIAPSLTVGYVPGATPAKWARTWAQRHPDVPLRLTAVEAADAADAVRAGTVDIALLRLPTDATGLAVIGLYAETTVVVVPADHLLTAVDEVAGADLAEEPMLAPLDDVVDWTAGVPVQHRPDTTRDAIELVAAGVGLLIVPQSLARLHHRKDLSYRPIVGAPTCAVALAFPDGEQSDRVQEFIGIVRGRKSSSSRGLAEPVPKRTAREKTLAKQAARAAAGKVGRPPAKRGKR